MSENKKVRLTFDSNTTLDFLDTDKSKAIAEIDICYENKAGEFNRNGCNISHETIIASKDSFGMCPIIFQYNNEREDYATDVLEHSKSLTDKTMKVGGAVPNNTSIKFIEKDGKIYTRVHAVIFKRYVPNLMRILKSKNGDCKVSIEIEAIGETDEKNIFIIEKFNLIGIALLGKDVMEGIEGSEMNIVKFSDKEIESLNNAYLQFSAKNIDIFEKIKNSKKDNGAENMGKIKINKSKEAMSNAAWGDIDKTELRNKVIDEPNADALVNFIYMRVDKDWRTAPSEKLGYPVGEIKGNEAVYNRGGLSSALGYAKAENDSEIVSKIEAIYKKLELNKEDDMEEKDKEIDNKLDKDNKDIAKIKDDADAIEDDKKEEVKENAIDKKEGEKLQDAVDADKDELEKKFSELEAKYNACNSELEKYKKKEEKEEMRNSLKSYRKCFSTKEELEEFSKNIEIDSKEDFEYKLNSKMKEFVKKMSEDEEDNDEMKKEEVEDIEKSFSFGLPISNFTIKDLNGKIETKDIDDVLNVLNKKK